MRRLVLPLLVILAPTTAQAQGLVVKDMTEATPALQQALGATPRPPLAGSSDCGDLLARMGKKPPQLTFVDCIYQPDRQAKPLTATYRVSGRDAASVEAYLIEAVGLPRLERHCCQWDTPYTWFKNADGLSYEIYMVSPETVVHSREEWAEISFFEIVVATFTEEI